VRGHRAYFIAIPVIAINTVVESARRISFCLRAATASKFGADAIVVLAPGTKLNKALLRPANISGYAKVIAQPVARRANVAS